MIPRPFIRLIVVLATLSAAPSLAIAQVAQHAASKPLERAILDTTCAPCTDFYQFANGNWLRKHTIPRDKTGLGSFGMLSDRNQEVVQKIVIDDASLARSGETKPGTNDWKIGTFYMACMDTVSMDAAGFKPIKPPLDENLAGVAAAGGTAAKPEDESALTGQVAGRRPAGEHAGVPGGVGMQGRRPDGATRQPQSQDLVVSPFAHDS